MNYINRLVVVLSLLFVSCDDDPPGKQGTPEKAPEKLECDEPEYKAATICCYDPTDDEKADCSEQCQPTCKVDEDCSEWESCQEGVCGPDGDCSL